MQRLAQDAAQQQAEYARDQMLGLAGIGGLAQGLGLAVLRGQSSWYSEVRSTTASTEVKLKIKRDNIIDELQDEVDDWLKDTI